MTTRSDTEGLLREALTSIVKTLSAEGGYGYVTALRTAHAALDATPPDTDPSGLDLTLKNSDRFCCTNPVGGCITCGMPDDD